MQYLQCVKPWGYCSDCSLALSHRYDTCIYFVGYIMCESVGTFHRNSCELRMTCLTMSLGQWLAQFLCYLLFANREISRSSACILVACIMLLHQVMSALYAHATGKHDVKHINKIKLMSCSDRIHYRDGCLLWDLILPKSITMISIIADIWKCGSRTLLTNGNKSRNPALG